MKVFLGIAAAVWAMAGFNSFMLARTVFDVGIAAILLSFAVLFIAAIGMQQPRERNAPKSVRDDLDEVIRFLRIGRVPEQPGQ